jgi:hypothetical protein
LLPSLALSAAGGGGSCAAARPGSTDTVPAPTTKMNARHAASFLFNVR